MASASLRSRARVPASADQEGLTSASSSSISRRDTISSDDQSANTKTSLIDTSTSNEPRKQPHHNPECHNQPPTPGVRDLTLMDLPPEIHLLISKQLTYPDALSLKHTSRYFYALVDTGVRLKVAWLMERRSLHLECPNDRRCDLGSDLRFCRGSVALLMQRRREHVECDSRPGLGCLVFGTPACVHRRSPRERAGRWLRAQLTVELWWVLLAAVPLFFGMVWAVEVGAVVYQAVVAHVA